VGKPRQIVERGLRIEVFAGAAHPVAETFKLPLLDFVNNEIAFEKVAAWLAKTLNEPNRVTFFASTAFVGNAVRGRVAFSKVGTHPFPILIDNVVSHHATLPFFAPASEPWEPPSCLRHPREAWRPLLAW